MLQVEQSHRNGRLVSVWVLQEATKVAIEGDNSLTVLLQCSSTDTNMHLPSWVPDWSSYVYDGLRDTVQVQEDLSFQSSGRSHVSFHFCGGDEKLQQSQSRLSVRGIAIEVLLYCAPDMHSDEQTWKVSGKEITLDEGGQHRYLRDSAIYKVIESWMEVAFKLSPYPTGEHLLQAFARTLILNQYRSLSTPLIWPNFDVQNGFSHWLLSHRMDSAPLNEKIADALSSFSQKYKEGFFKDIEQEDAEITTAKKAEHVQRSLERSKDAMTIQSFVRDCTQENRFFHNWQ